jgi:hypothetical protein
VAWDITGESIVSNGIARIYSSSGAFTAIRELSLNLMIGETYKLVYDVTSAIAGNIRLNNGSVLNLPSVIGRNEFIFTSSSNGDFGIKREGVTDISIDNISLTLATPEIIPNNNEGQPITPIVEGDTFVSGTSFLNDSPWRVRLFTTGDTDSEYTFFDKSDTDIYEAAVQASDNYIIGDTGNFHKDEIKQLWNWENIKVAYKYKWWVRILGNQFRHMVFYNTALSDSKDISDATFYTNTPEP